MAQSPEESSPTSLAVLGRCLPRRCRSPSVPGRRTSCRIGSIAAIAQVAPLVGILGTVLGMIATFLAFEKGGNYAMAAALSRGMWQALLATAGSLMLAIPAHLAHHFLTARVRSIVRDVEWSGNEIMKYLLTEYRGRLPADGETDTGA